MIGKYCMVITESAGFYVGTLVNRNGNEAILKNARRIWHWAGADTLHQLAQSGTSAPKKCGFLSPVDNVLLIGVTEIIHITDAAKKTLDEVPAWKARIPTPEPAPARARTSAKDGTPSASV